MEPPKHLAIGRIRGVDLEVTEDEEFPRRREAEFGDSRRSNRRPGVAAIIRIEPALPTQKGVLRGHSQKARVSQKVKNPGNLKFRHRGDARDVELRKWHGQFQDGASVDL